MCDLFRKCGSRSSAELRWQMGLGVAKDRANELPQANDWMRYRRFGWCGDVPPLCLPQFLTILYTFVLLLVAIGAPFESCAPQNSAPFLRDGHARPPGDGGTDTKASSTRPADVGQQLLRATSYRGHRRVAATHLAVLHHRARALAQGARRFLGRHRG